MSVKPRKGDAVLFWTMMPDGTEDSATIHGSCDVLKGEKWSATIWCAAWGAMVCLSTVLTRVLCYFCAGFAPASSRAETGVNDS